MTVNYMAEIRGVATSVQTDIQYESVESRVLSLWNDFESHARELTDNILITINNKPLRTTLKCLVRILYLASPGSPDEDCQQLVEKNAEYGGSWVRRGGRGAFHALARKADRIIEQLKIHKTFQAAREAKSGESIDDTLGDLRRYLILVEAYHVAEEKIHQKALANGMPASGRKA